VLVGYADDAPRVASIIAGHSDEVTDVLDMGVVHVRPEVAGKLACELSSVTGRQVLVSATSGRVYVSAPTEVQQLIKTLATASTGGSGERVVLGRHVVGGGYIQEGLDGGGVFFETTNEVYDRLKRAGIDPWLLNEAVLRQQAEAGLPFEYALRGLEPRPFEAEVRAIDLIGQGDVEAALVALRLAEGSPMPAGLKEIAWLMENGYSGVVDYAEQVIRWTHS
jgi:hypothetical protein